MNLNFINTFYVGFIVGMAVMVAFIWFKERQFAKQKEVENEIN